MDLKNVAQYVHTDLPSLSDDLLCRQCRLDYAHYQYAHCLFQPLPSQLVIVCSPDRIQSLTSSQMWLINLLVALNELQLPCCVSGFHDWPASAGYLDVVNIFSEITNKYYPHSQLICVYSGAFMIFLVESFCFCLALCVCSLNYSLQPAAIYSIFT